MPTLPDGGLVREMRLLKDMSPKQYVMFMDGPLEGRVLSFPAGTAVPNTISQQDPGDPSRIYFYRVLGSLDHYQAFFDYSEYPHIRQPTNNRTSESENTAGWAFN